MGWTEDDIRSVHSKLARWVEDAEGPVRFAKEALGISPVPDQLRLLRALGGFDIGAGKFGITARSGQGCGKSTSSAIAILWFLVCHTNSLVQATAPTEKQIHSILWGECEKLIRSSKFLNSVLEWQATRIGVRGENAKWQAIARTSRNVENMQGEHAKDMLLVVDEASGIEDVKLEALLGGLTEPHNVALMISNPTRPHGVFYESHTKDADLWYCLHFNARQSPLVDAAHIRRMERKYGARSPIIRIRVDGDFPSQSETSLISLDWLMQAKETPAIGDDNGYWQMGVDVARYGADMTAVCVRCGDDIVFLDRWHGANLTESAGRITKICKQFPLIETVSIDESGVGAGLVDIMHEYQGEHGTLAGVDVVGVNAGNSSDDSEQWPLLRDQMWCEFAQRLQEGRVFFRESADPDMVDILSAQCMGIEYKFNALGARKIESKDDIRKKTGGSPDVVEAALLAFREGEVGVIGWV